MINIIFTAFQVPYKIKIFEKNLKSLLTYSALYDKIDLQTRKDGKKPRVRNMNKQIKELFNQEDATLKINDFCALHFYKKDALFEDNNGRGWLVVDFKCSYGKTGHSAHIDSREPNDIKEAIKKEQAYFFDGLRDMLNKQIDGGYIG